MARYTIRGAARAFGRAMLFAVTAMSWTADYLVWRDERDIGWVVGLTVVALLLTAVAVRTWIAASRRLKRGGLSDEPPMFFPPGSS